MRTRKIVRILAALPDEVRQEFHSFLASPFHNTSELLAALARLFEDLLILQTEKDYSAEEIHALLPTKSVFKSNYFDKLCAQLSSLLNDFLAIRRFKGNKLAVMENTFASYEEFGLDEWVPGLFKQVKPSKTPEFWHNARGLQHLVMLHMSMARYQTRQPRAKMEIELIKVDEFLDAYYFAQKMELATAAANLNRQFNTDLSLKNVESTLKMIEEGIDSLPIIVRLQGEVYKVMSGKYPEALRGFIKLLKKEDANIGDHSKLFFYTGALNEYYLRLNNGEEELLPEIVDLLDFLVEKEILLDRGRLNPDHFKNIITAKFRLKDFSGAETFFNKWCDKLESDHNGYLPRFLAALISFHKGEYSQCLKELEVLLGEYKDDVFLYMDARVWMLKAIYERNLPDDGYFLDSHLNAFRVFFSRDKKLSPKERSHFRMYVKLMRKLVNLRDMEQGEKRTRRLNSFVEELSSQSEVGNAIWFIEKAKELL